MRMRTSSLFLATIHDYFNSKIKEQRYPQQNADQS